MFAAVPAPGNCGGSAAGHVTCSSAEGVHPLQTMCRHSSAAISIAHLKIYLVYGIIVCIGSCTVYNFLYWTIWLYIYMQESYVLSSSSGSQQLCVLGQSGKAVLAQVTTHRCITSGTHLVHYDCAADQIT